MSTITLYDFGKVREKMLRDTKTPADHVDVAIAEFRRFLILIRLGWDHINMTSHLVDEVWHTFILFTQDYIAFCDEVFSSYLHHTPSAMVSRSEAAKSMGNFLEAYQTVFGEVPTIWLAKQNDGPPAQLCAPTHTR